MNTIKLGKIQESILKNQLIFPSIYELSLMSNDERVKVLREIKEKYYEKSPNITIQNKTS